MVYILVWNQVKGDSLNKKQTTATTNSKAYTIGLKSQCSMSQFVFCKRTSVEKYPVFTSKKNMKVGESKEIHGLKYLMFMNMHFTPSNLFNTLG
jgi:hypothetical protein